MCLRTNNVGRAVRWTAEVSGREAHREGTLRCTVARAESLTRAAHDPKVTGSSPADYPQGPEAEACLDPHVETDKVAARGGYSEVVSTEIPRPPPSADPPAAPRRTWSDYGLLVTMIAAGTYVLTAMEERDGDGKRINQLDVASALVGVVGVWLLLSSVAWVISRLAKKPRSFWQMATAPPLVASMLMVWLIAGCGAVSRNIS